MPIKRWVCPDTIVVRRMETFGVSCATKLPHLRAPSPVPPASLGAYEALVATKLGELHATYDRAEYSHGVSDEECVAGHFTTDHTMAKSFPICIPWTTVPTPQDALAIAIDWPSVIDMTEKNSNLSPAAIQFCVTAMTKAKPNLEALVRSRAYTCAWGPSVRSGTMVVYVGAPWEILARHSVWWHTGLSE